MKYQSHSHTFTCAKKSRTITIKQNEGHGRHDGRIEREMLVNIPVCRFRFPKFPIDETCIVQAMPKDIEEKNSKERTKDFNMLMKYLIRQTHTEGNLEEHIGWKNLQKLNFYEFLYEAGMFSGNRDLRDYSDEEKQKAKARYLNAISASVKGSAIVLLKREVKNMFVNGFNAHIMRLHQANHDMQICIDQYSCAQYICGYLTKNEAGISKLLKAVNEECTNFKEIDKINALATVLDKNREVSIQEAIYRLLGLPMAKSSVKVKYLSTIHPNFRDGLLKGKIEELSSDESVFHTSPHEYYENRPEVSNEDGVVYAPEELVEGYWEDLSLTEFWGKYEVVYDKNAKVKFKEGKRTKVQTLKNKKGFIRKRSDTAILRYYLNYNNDEDLARGLLILFKPYRNEMIEIHQKDVKELLAISEEVVTEKRQLFEKYKVMTDLIADIQTQFENKGDAQDDALDEEDSFEDLETTDKVDIQNFNKWAHGQAAKELSSLKYLTDLWDTKKLRSNISLLNRQQRKLFDDLTERMVSTDISEHPVHLFLTGNAGTGKSFVANILIEAIKHIMIKAGDELKKPSVLVMAPTANAAHIIGGKTIDSVLRFNPNDPDHYTQADAASLGMMKFQYEDVKVVFCDEISMVGSKKLTKINYRFQELAEGSKKQEFMGGLSFIALGKFPKRNIKVNL